MTREEASLRTKNNLLQAVYDLTSKKSFSEITVREICETANVTTGAFYAHFNSKDDMIASIREKLDAFMFNYSSIEGGTAEEKLLSCITIFARFNSGNDPEDTLKLHMTSPFMLDSKNPLFKSISDQLLLGQETGEFYKDFDVNELTTLILLAISGCTVNWAKNKGSYSLDPQVKKMVKLLIHSIKKPF